MVGSTLFRLYGMVRNKKLKLNRTYLIQIWKSYEKQERDIVPKGTSNKWPVLFATNILSLSGQTREGVSKGIFNRKVRQEVAKIAKG